MRHFVRLGLRGLLMEFGAILMRVHGGYCYRQRLRARQAR
jgi:hypothetical protein